jgi:hypothetical protein
MEPLPKQCTPAVHNNPDSPTTDGGSSKLMPPAFNLPGPEQNACIVPTPYADYEQSHHGLWMQALLDDLAGQPREFVGGLREYLLKGIGLSGNQGRTLAAVEAVIGHKFSPAAEAWMKAAATSNPDQVAEIKASTRKTFAWVIEESEGEGTAKTTAPIAANSSNPGFVARQEVFHERWLFEMAGVVAAWADKRMDTTTGQAKFKAEDLSGDKKQMAALKAASNKLLEAEFPMKKNKKTGELYADDKRKYMFKDYGTINLDWILRFMVYHEQVTPPAGTEPAFTFLKDKGAAGVAYAEQATKVNGLNDKTRKGFNREDPANGLFESSMIDTSMSSDNKQVKQEAGMVADLAKLEAAAAAETDAKKKEKLLVKVEKAKQALHDHQRYRSFASTNMALIERVSKLNKTASFGSYIGHSWGQFSADIFLGTSLKPDKFWKESVVLQFFDDLNTAAEMDESATGGVGKYAWRAIYNDENTKKEVDKKYGKGRQITGIAGHGPAPEIHIHLDARLLDMKPDATTGYTTNANGRVVTP